MTHDLLPYTFIKFAFVPFIIYYGFVAAFGDLKEGKIPNRHIVLGLKIGAALHAGVCGILLWTHRAELVPTGFNDVLLYLGIVALNTAAALAVSFFMWWMHLWAAGDAKLFTIMVFLVPVDFYSKFSVRFFPGFVLLYNVFIVSLLVILGDLALKTFRTARGLKAQGLLKEKISASIGPAAVWKTVSTGWRGMLRILTGLVFSFLATSLIRKSIADVLQSLVRLKFTIDLHSLAVNESIVFLLFFLFFRPLSYIFQNVFVYFTTLACIIGYMILNALFQHNLKGVADVLRFGGLSMALIAFRQAYDYYSERINMAPMPLSDLRENLILGRKSLETIRAASVDLKERFSLVYADGLTTEQVEALKEWKGMDPIEVSGTIPFAPCIFVGAIFTIIFQGIMFEKIVIK